MLGQTDLSRSGLSCSWGKDSQVPKRRKENKSCAVGETLIGKRLNDAISYQNQSRNEKNADRNGRINGKPA